MFNKSVNIFFDKLIYNYISDIISLSRGEKMSELKIQKDTEYMSVIDKYLKEDKVQLMKEIPHHDSNRFNHSLKVSYLSYKACRKLNLDYESVAKAGLLHDLYFNRIEECTNASDKIKLFMNDHPETALINARELFHLNKKEENIILSHMWPASKHFPKYKESLVVGAVDKYLSINEFKDKNVYRFSYNLGVYFLMFTFLIFR